AWYPRGDSRPHWGLATEIGAALGLPHRWAAAREVFLDLSKRLATGALGDFRWDSLPSVGRRRGLVPLAAGTVDGRLPGYRERVDPEIQEDMRRTLPVLGPGGG